MTETQDLDPERYDPVDTSHEHGALVGHWTYTTRSYACGHIVAERGHLDLTSRRMVWDEAMQDEPEFASTVNALGLLNHLCRKQIAELQAPPW